jgi:NTE family protein
MKEKESFRKSTAKVILSGGAALGLAEIGVLQVLEQRFEITGIIGTSIGSIIGGLYAMGYAPLEIIKLANLTKKQRLFSPFNLDRTLSGIFDGKTILKLFEEWTRGSRIEQCRIPFLAVSYDLNRRNTIILDRGPLACAMRASSSIPYVFSPYQWGKYSLVDGGIEYPLPLGLATQLQGDITIAVNVLPVNLTEPERIDLDSVSAKVRKMRMNEVFLRSIFQNQAFLALHSIVDNKPDIVIDACYPKGSVFGFHQAEKYSRWGAERAEEALKNFGQPHHFDKLRTQYKTLIDKLSTGFPKRVL